LGENERHKVVKQKEAKGIRQKEVKRIIEILFSKKFNNQNLKL